MRAHKKGEIVVLAPVNGEPDLQVWRLRGSRVSLGTIVAARALSCKAQVGGVDMQSVRRLGGLPALMLPPALLRLQRQSIIAS